jgi:hypothetical protein
MKPSKLQEDCSMTYVLSYISAFMIVVYMINKAIETDAPIMELILMVTCLSLIQVFRYIIEIFSDVEENRHAELDSNVNTMCNAFRGMANILEFLVIARTIVVELAYIIRALATRS